MLFRRVLLVSPLALLFRPAAAHGPTRQKVSEKITIAAPAAAVWARIGNFDALKDWHPAVAESTADKGNNEGSVRLVKLKGGGQIVESLESHNAAQMKYSYRAKDGGALPVTTVRLNEPSRAESQALARLSGRFCLVPI